MPADEGFIFTGSAVAFGARLDEPRRIREVRGSLTLPDIGGTADASQDGADLGIVKFRAAHTSATGEGYVYKGNRGKKQYETRVACTLEGFNLGRDDGIIRADYVSATLVSTFLDHHVFREETVTLRGLWADDKDWAVERRTPPALNIECTSLQELVDAAKVKGQLVDDPRLLLTSAASGQPSEHAGKLALVNGRLVCYLLEPSYIEFTTPRGVRYEIFLGEYVLDQDRRRLSMMRIEASAGRGGGGGKGKDSFRDGDDASRRRGGRAGTSDEEKDPEGTVTVVQPLVNGHRPP